MKRAFSFVLALVMILALVPAVSAADDATLIQTASLTVTHGQTQAWDYGFEELYGAAPDGSSITWQASGDQIIAVAAAGADIQSGALLTFKNELTVPATLRFAYTLTNTNSYAEFRDLEGNPVAATVEMELDGGESFTAILISPDPWETADPATLTITGLSLSTGGDATATFYPGANGSYTVDGESITGEKAYTAEIGAVHTLSATAASGYRFFGWHDGAQYVGYKADATITISQDIAITPVFIKDDVTVFGVGDMRFQSLSEADAYASSGAVKTIVLMNDGILSGEHTVSAGNTLLIPYDEAGSLHTQATSIAVQLGDTWENKAWEEPKAYRTLTMTEGAKITVHGSLNVGGKHSSGAMLPTGTPGSPSGNLGMIQMAEDSNITVADGGILYCWGYIYGDGTVTVKNGGTAHENFQFTDFRGGNATVQIAQSFMVFPITQYYVQNIEVASTFEYGATEHVWGSLFLQGKVHSTSVKFIGTDKNLCMFVPGESGSVVKTYDPATDRLNIEVNGGGSINPLALELGGMAINTATFMLPITNNMSIHIHSGTTNLNQSLALLPGVELTIDKDATLALKSGEPLKDSNGNYVHYRGGHNLIVYDRDQWLNAYQPVYDGNNVLIGATPVETYFVFSGKRLQPLVYSPSRDYTRTVADLKDAVVDINGKLITDGFIYTTVDINLADFFYYGKVNITSGGASVISSQGSGVLVMNNGTGPDAITLQPIQVSDQASFAYLPMASARLQNEDGSYLDTLGSAAGATYNSCAQCGKWYATGSNAHTVDITWVVDGTDGTLEVCKDTVPVYNEGTDPVKDGYKFTGWSTGNDNTPEYTSATLPAATTDATYWACFEEDTGLRGDVTKNGVVDMEDFVALARHIGLVEEITDAVALANADVTGEGDVDMSDFVKLAQYIGNVITDLN